MSDEVMLHRSVSLDQMAEFDPNTGLWHSDGTFEVVRFHEVLPTDGKENVTHIALPAAKHAALMRAVDALRALRRAERDLSWEALNAARHDADRALMVIDTTAPERQGEEPK